MLDYSKLNGSDHSVQYSSAEIYGLGQEMGTSTSFRLSFRTPPHCYDECLLMEDNLTDAPTVALPFDMPPPSLRTRRTSSIQRYRILDQDLSWCLT